MQFYVYELVVVPDELVCYVGKGSGKRMYIHKRNLLNSRYQQTGLYRRLRALLSSGKGFEPRKVFETDFEQEALAEEKRRIELYGFDNLFNSTTHQGLTVACIDAAHRQALSKARREYVAKLQREHGYKMPPEVAAKVAAIHRGLKHSAESVARAVVKRKANPALQQFLVSHCRRLADGQRGKKQSAEHIENAHAPLRGRKASESECAMRSACLIGKASRHNAKSKYRGVTWLAPQRAWQSRIQLNGRTKFLGTFKMELDAAFTYDEAFEAAHGSRPNSTSSLTGKSIGGSG